MQSRDYKYNRQAFDQNARSMTEKYARAGETEGAGSSHRTQAPAGRSTAQVSLWHVTQWDFTWGNVNESNQSEYCSIRLIH